MLDSTSPTRQAPIIADSAELLMRGICRVTLPENINWNHWAETLSKPTVDSLGFEDGEYAFYRNILDETDFPFDEILNHCSSSIVRYFGVEDLAALRLDDAFCVHYNTSQLVTSGKKHTDPSDITINLCIEKSRDVIGSEVKFFGSRPLADTDFLESDECFLVSQEEGYATVHWGDHPHETLKLSEGRRTNIVMTLWFRDPARTKAASRTCYQ